MIYLLPLTTPRRNTYNGPKKTQKLKRRRRNGLSKLTQYTTIPRRKQSQQAIRHTIVAYTLSYRLSFALPAHPSDSCAFLSLGDGRIGGAGALAPVHLVVVGLEDLHLAAGADGPQGVVDVGARLVLAPGAAGEDGAQRGQAAHYDAEAEFDAGELLACGICFSREGAGGASLPFPGDEV